MKDYINHLYRPIPSDGGENQRFFAERELLFGQLLVTIAKSLSINLDADEVRHFRYAPIGWANVEVEQQQVRKLLINFLQGITPISVRPAAGQPPTSQAPPALFPQPPTIDGPSS